MDWSETLRKAIKAASSSGEITFGELDGLITSKSVPNRDLEELLNALREHGIRVVEK
jgi:hypothetical protein